MSPPGSKEELVPLLASHSRSQKFCPNILWCTGIPTPPKLRTIKPKISIDMRLRKLDIGYREDRFEK